MKSRKYESVPVVKMLANKIILYRTQNDVSREELALNVGISPRQLVNIENCDAICKVTTALKIAHGIGLDFNELLKLLED